MVFLEDNDSEPMKKEPSLFSAFMITLLLIFIGVGVGYGLWGFPHHFAKKAGDCEEVVTMLNNGIVEHTANYAISSSAFGDTYETGENCYLLNKKHNGTAK